MEYGDIKFLKIISQNGATIHRSCPETSQHNDQAEHKHKQILDGVCTIPISATCPQQF